MEQKNPIQVAGRLFRTLELLAETGSAGLMELSSSLELNKTTAHRVLNSLIYMGYARQNPVSGKYEPTFKIVDMANKIMAKVDIVQTVRPYLRKLMEATGETVHFVERDGIDAVYIRISEQRDPDGITDRQQDSSVLFGSGQSHGGRNGRVGDRGNMEQQ